MFVFDSHCDTACRLAKGEGLLCCGGHWSLERARQYEGFVQFFAAFVPPEEPDPAARCLTLLDAVEREVEQNADKISKVTCWQETKHALKEGKTAAFLTVEGGFGKDCSMVERLYQKGVRCMSLCWNQDNDLCGGIEGKGGGVTRLGRQAVEEMNRLGMILDVSHCSEQSFFDFASLVQKPLIATHSNAREVCPHPRNLTREQFCVIRDMGGMVGLNLYPPFLRDRGGADVTDLVRHIEYFLSLDGENCIGLGADFDGIDCCMKGVCGIQDYSFLYEELCRYFQESLVKRLFCENYISFLKNHL
ncbi:MAG: dipeptidase [Clostridia bacterium]|nr:dipeptidase [Clostridia bacterium]